MGKNKKQQEHRKKGKVENEEEDILTEVSEFLGIPVWEVTKADVKKYKRDNGIEDKDEEEEENEEEEEEEENEDEEKDNKEEQIKEDNKEVKEEDTKVKETKVEEIKEDKVKEEEIKTEEVKETTNIKEETTTEQQTETESTTTESSLKMPKALNNNDTPLSNDVQYPIITMLTPNITKITTDIDYTDSITYLGDTVPSLPSTFLNEIPSSSSTSSKSHIQFLPVKHIYEYPKEDSKQPNKPIHKKQKTKDNNTNDNHINTKQSKKDSKVKSSDDLDEDEMKRLQEIRKRREEFAYLEKIRKEEEEQKRKEREEQKAKEPVKKSYKPKPKKKRK